MLPPTSILPKNISNREGVSPYENTDMKAKPVSTADIIKTRLKTIDAHELGPRKYASVAAKSMKGIKTYVGGGQQINMSRHR